MINPRSTKTSRHGRLQSASIFPQVGRAPGQGERLGPFPAPCPSRPKRRGHEIQPVDANGGFHDGMVVHHSNEWLMIAIPSMVDGSWSMIGDGS